MVELSSLQEKVIAPYLQGKKYAQIEDVLRDAAILINKAQLELLEEVYSKKANGKPVNKEIVVLSLNTILKQICAVMYCFDFDLPDEDEYQELDEYIPDLINSDLTLTLFNIQHAISQLALDYWLDTDEDEEINSVDAFDNCMTIFASIKMISETYEITLQDLIFT